MKVISKSEYDLLENWYGDQLANVSDVSSYANAAVQVLKLTSSLQAALVCLSLISDVLIHHGSKLSCDQLIGLAADLYAKLWETEDIISLHLARLITVICVYSPAMVLII